MCYDQWLCLTPWQVYEFMLDVPWSSSTIDVQPWLLSYARRRYGLDRFSTNATSLVLEAWGILA
jgi:hypothetical protein